VNATTPYEQLIAAKLDQMPVPDMSDSIWSGIEMQLDADAPDKKPAKKYPKYKGKGWYGLIGIMAVVTLVWWNYSHISHAPANTAPRESIPTTKEPLPAKDSSVIIDKPKKTPPPIAPVPIKKDTLLHNNDSIDSAFKQDPPPARIDTPSGQDNRGQPLPVGPEYIPLSVKKHRGVKGITDDDYKISAKKDSAGRRH